MTQNTTQTNNRENTLKSLKALANWKPNDGLGRTVDTMSDERLAVMLTNLTADKKKKSPKGLVRN